MENYYDSERKVIRVPEKLIKYYGREEIKMSKEEWVMSLFIEQFIL